MLFALENNIRLNNLLTVCCKIFKYKNILEGVLRKEKGYDENNICIIECKKRYFLDSKAVDTLKGDFSKAKRLLKWKPQKNLDQLIKDMVSYELNLLISDKKIQKYLLQVTMEWLGQSNN